MAIIISLQHNLFVLVQPNDVITLYMVCCFFFCLRDEQSAQCKIVIEKYSHLLILGRFGIAYARPVATGEGGERNSDGGGCFTENEL